MLIAAVRYLRVGLRIRLLVGGGIQFHGRLRLAGRQHQCQGYKQQKAFHPLVCLIE